MSQQSHFWVRTQKNWKQGLLEQVLVRPVYSRSIHNSHRVETTPVSWDRWTGKQDVVYTEGILLSLEKEGSSATCCHTVEPQRHEAPWNKPDTKGRILNNFSGSVRLNGKALDIWGLGHKLKCLLYHVWLEVLCICDNRDFPNSLFICCCLSWQLPFAIKIHLHLLSL